MNRRRLLKLGATASVAAATEGCSAFLPENVTDDMTDAVMGKFLADLDGSVARIGEADMSKLFALGAKTGPEPPPRPGDVLLVKKALRSLSLTGAYRELDAKAKEHPGVKERVEAAQPELDEAVLGMAALLGDLNEGDRVELQRRLDADPSLAKRIAEQLDEDMKRMDMPPERRLRLRRLAQHITWRLERQPVSVLLDEYVDKVDKVARRVGYDEQLKRQIAARAAASSLLTWRDPATAAAETAAATETHPELRAWEERLEEDERLKKGACSSSSDGSVAMTVGGVVLGVSGALAIGGGIAVASGGLAGAYVLTAAGVLLLVGLIVLIVGAVMDIDSTPSRCAEGA